MTSKILLEQLLASRLFDLADEYCEITDRLWNDGLCGHAIVFRLENLNDSVRGVAARLTANAGEAGR